MKKTLVIIIATISITKSYSQNDGKTIEQIKNAQNLMDIVSLQKNAMEKVENGNYIESIVAFTQLINLEPKVAINYFMRGRSKDKAGDLRGALADYNKTYEIGGIQEVNKYYEDFYSTRAICKGNLKDYSGAIADFSKIIEKSPKNSIAYSNRAVCKVKLDDYRGAIADYTKSIEINPNSAEYYKNRGMCKINLNLIDSACMDFSKAGELGLSSAYDSIRDYCN